MKNKNKNKIYKKREKKSLSRMEKVFFPIENQRFPEKGKKNGKRDFWEGGEGEEF